MKSEESKQPSSGKEAKSQTILLSDVLSTEQLTLLHKQWIETPEQLLSIAATDEGQVGLCKLLSIENDRLQTILNWLRADVSPGIVGETSSPKPGGKLGVILTEDQIGKHRRSEEGDKE